jgi:HSP20 family protein
MADAATKLTVKNEPKETTPPPARLPEWHPFAGFAGLRQEIDRLFDDFGAGFWRSPIRRSLLEMAPFSGREWRFELNPAVDVVEDDKSYQITAELPGLGEKDIEVQYSDGVLTLKGEKREEKEEKKTDYYVSERRYGSFRRAFQVPDDVDADKIEANFKNGVLTLSLPKSPQARKQEKKITVTAK